MFSALGSVVVRRPWWVLATWAGLTALLIPLSPGLDAVTNEDQTSFLPDSYESVQAQELAERAFPEQAGSGALFVVSAADGGPLSTADRRAVETLARDLRDAGLERVRGVSTGEELLSPDRKVQLVRVAIEGLAFDDPVAETIEELRNRAGALRSRSASAGRRTSVMPRRCVGSQGRRRYLALHVQPRQSAIEPGRQLPAGVP